MGLSFFLFILVWFSPLTQQSQSPCFLPHSVSYLSINLSISACLLHLSTNLDCFLKGRFNGNPVSLFKENLEEKFLWMNLNRISFFFFFSFLFRNGQKKSSVWQQTYWHRTCPGMLFWKKRKYQNPYCAGSCFSFLCVSFLFFFFFWKYYCYQLFSWWWITASLNMLFPPFSLR